MITHEFSSVGELWVSLTRRCLQEGAHVLDADVKLLEVLNVPVSVSDPLVNHDPAEAYFDPKMVAAMHDNFHTFEPQFGYKVSYGERIFRPEGASPYEAIRDTLRKKPEAKSATISLLRPNDAHLGHVPCITTIDFKIRAGKLNVGYFARSQDVFKKSYADNLAISEIGAQLAGDLADDFELSPGSITGFIVSAHLYLSDLGKMAEMEPFADLAAGLAA